MPLTFLWANLTMSLGPLVATPDRTRTVLFTPGTPQETIDRVAPRVGDESYLAYLDMLLFGRPDPRKVGTPILVVGGASDFLFPPKDSNTTARAYDGPAHIVPESGHDLMLEERWREAADAMLDWFDTLGT
jgi:pimeloyl-ACP methyl ester carboxylesterase